MIDEKWLCNRGGNLKPNSKQEDSENPSTINAQYYFLLLESGEMTAKQENMAQWLNYQKWSTNNDRYMTNSYDFLRIEHAKCNGFRSPDRFSLDEAISVAAISRRFGHWANLKKIELFTRSYALRPDTLSFLLLAKYPIFNLLLVPRFFVSLSMIIACLRKPQDTSGKNLAYIRYMGLKMNWTWWLCMKVLRNKDMSEVRNIWFPERDHPINVLSRKVEGLA